MQFLFPFNVSISVQQNMKILQRTLKHFLNRTLRRQTLANIIEIFQNAYHADLHFT